MNVLVIVTSPLQMLIASQICKKYIGDHISYYILVEDKDIRQENLKALANYWNVNYEIHYFSEFKGVGKYFKLLKSLFLDKKYDKAIIGMYFNIASHLIAIKYLKNESEVIYIDDGTATFGIMDERIFRLRMKSPIWKYVNMMFFLKGINHKRFLTIFENIKSKYYSIEIAKPFTGTNLFESKRNSIFVLGTNRDMYLDTMSPNMSISVFNNFLIRIFNYLKENNPCEKIYYSPHGRDNALDIIEYCENNGIDVIRSKYSVEIDYVINNYNPRIIIGLSSTALFTLKIMFPAAEVIDVVAKGYNCKFVEARNKFMEEMKSLGIKSYSL